MRRSLVSVGLSLVILAICVALGLWFSRGREGDRAGGDGVGRQPDRALTDPSSADGSVLRGEGNDTAGAVSESGKTEEAPATSIDASGLAISIEGRVSDPDERGVGEARVAVVSRTFLTETVRQEAKRLDREPLEVLRTFRRSLGEMAKKLPSTTTALDGSYALRGLPEDEYRVIVTHGDYLTHAEGDWLLVTKGEKVRYDVELESGHEISGFARDTEGRPVAGARVRATPVEVSRLKGLGKLVQIFIDQTEGNAIIEDASEESDAKGAFRLASIAPGAYDLRCSRDGYAWGEARGVASGSEEVEIVLAPAIRVSGRVVSPSSEPVVGAELVLREPERDLKGPAGPMTVAFIDVDLFGEKDRRATSDDEGRFALEAFVKGTYELLVRAEGFPERRKPLSLEGSSLALGDIVLAENREIAGTVLSPDGRTMDTAEVWVPKPAAERMDLDSRRNAVLEAGPSWSLARSHTDSRGRFRLSGLDEGRFDVAVLAEGYPAGFVGEIAAGDDRLTIVLERGLTVRGMVVDRETREPLPEARIVVEGGPAIECPSDEDGRFEIEGIGLPRGSSAGGTVVVRASLREYRDGRATLAFPDPASVPVGETTIEMAKLGDEASKDSVSGIVRDAAGVPLGGARVWVEVPGIPRVFFHMRPDAVKDDVRTEADGTFSVPTPQVGNRNFEILASYPGLATSRVGPLAKRDEAELPYVEIRMSEGSTIEGHVTNRAGTALAGARIRIWKDLRTPDDETIFDKLLPQAEGRTTSTAEDGSYRLKKVEPGSYRIEARATGHAAQTLGPLEIGSGALTRDEGSTSSGASATRIDFALDAGGSLEGRVADPEGSPLQAVEVVVFPVGSDSVPNLEAEDELIQTGALGLATATTGTDGRYEIGHLPEGDFLVVARTRGYELGWLSPVRPGEALPDIVLTPHARVSGRAFDVETRVPVGSYHVQFERKDAEGVFHNVNRASRDVLEAEGRFAAEGLRAGEWRLRVDAKGYAPWRKTLSLAPGGEASIDIALRAGRRIEGVVERPDGTPVVGATIQTQIETQRRDGERRSVDAVLSEADGSFVIAGLDPGVYQVAASHPEHYAEGLEALAKVELSPAVDAVVRLVLRPAGRIAGRVRGLVWKSPGADIWVIQFRPTAGEPASGSEKRRTAEGREAPPPSGPSYSCWADENGSFQQDSIRPGKYRLELMHRRNAPETGDEWITVPPETRPLGEIEIRADELATFQGEAP